MNKKGLKDSSVRWSFFGPIKPIVYRDRARFGSFSALGERLNGVISLLLFVLYSGENIDLNRTPVPLFLEKGT
jgi:hypothetical protein